MIPVTNPVHRRTIAIVNDPEYSEDVQTDR